MKRNDVEVVVNTVEVLTNFGSKQRYSGVVSKIDGTTTFIKSGDREFLAWSRSDLIVGTSVEFSIDQFRAVRIIVTPTLPVPEPELKTELPLVEPEINEEESISAMRLAWRRIQKEKYAATE